MSDQTTVIEAGQHWALDDPQQAEPRRVDVLETSGSYVRLQNRRRRWWISEKRFRRLGRYLGHRGPGVLPPFTGSRLQGCLNAGAAATTLPVDRPLAVGFGQVTVTADERVMWSGDDETMTVAAVEEWATSAPDCDWRIEFLAPLAEFLYQRQQDGWVLVCRGDGFA